jgi:S-adenosylmethionine decarboxylase
MGDDGLRDDHPPAVGRTGTFGWHLTLDGYLGDPARLGDAEVIRGWLEEMPAALGMDKLMAPCLVEVGPRNEKDSGGVTGFVLVVQSHLSLHTFPRRRFVSADVYTCQDHLDHESIRRSLIATFGLGEIETHLIPRGTCYPLVDLAGEPRTDSPYSG